MKALLIGCGNIGALYDLNGDKVQTYAKALSLQADWHVSVFDTDRELAEKVAAQYDFQVVNAVDPSNYDIVCIAAPTQYHHFYLKQALLERVPFVFCEKPVSPKLAELEELERLYTNGSSKVVVNYIRRFQPVYNELREALSLPHWRACPADAAGIEGEHNSERKIVFRYRRGLLNNGTHGLDLIAFLTGKQPDLSKARIHGVQFDAFTNDPTVACTLPQDGFTIELESVAGTELPVFEMELTGDRIRLQLLDNGHTVRLYREGQPVRESKNVLANYMEPIIALPERMLADRQINDNFMESCDLNRRVLELMQTL